MLEVLEYDVNTSDAKSVKESLHRDKAELLYLYSGKLTDGKIAYIWGSPDLV